MVINYLTDDLLLLSRFFLFLGTFNKDTSGEEKFVIDNDNNNLIVSYYLLRYKYDIIRF